MTRPNLYRLISLFALVTCFSIEGECFKQRVIGGESTRPGEFKYIVYIKSVGGGFMGTCTGGILSKDIILTAAHCVIDQKTNQFANKRISVIAGSNDVNNPYNRGIEIPVIAVMIPRSYNILRGNDADIALLKLWQPLNLLDRRLAQLSLPTIKVNDLKDPRFEFAGFGRTDSIDLGNGRYGHYKEIDGKLIRASMLLDKSCEPWKPSNLPKNRICAKMINTKHLRVIGVCKGDSGGPLVQGTTVYGVTSFGTTSCNQNDAPTVFTNVADFTAFIKQALDGQLSERFRVANRAGYIHD